MSTLKEWTGMDFSQYKRAFSYFSELWDWLKIYHTMRKGEFRLENTMKLADLYTKRHNKKYYVVPTPSGKYIAINSSQFHALKRGKNSMFKHDADIIDLFKLCCYHTSPKNYSRDGK